MAWLSAEGPTGEQLLTAVLYGLIGVECWDNRAELGAWLSGMMSSCLAQTERRSSKRTLEAVAEDAWVQTRMGELRVASFQRFTDWVLPVYVLVISGLSFYFNQIDVKNSAYKNNYLSIIALGVVIQAARMLRRSFMQLTPGNVKYFYVFISALSICRVLTAEPNPYFHTTNGIRTVFRAVLSIVFFDVRLSLVINSVWSAVLIYFEVWKQQGLHHCSAPPHPHMFVGIELAVLVSLHGLSWFAEAFVESHVRLSLGLTSAQNVQQAVRRLLCALCDCELQLSPSLEIRHPSRRAAGLLAPDKQAGPAAIEGRSFVDFIAGADRERLGEFLSASAGAARAGAEPPRSMHLKLCDSVGCSMPVEIFQANLPDVQSNCQPGHLLGIRECAAGQREASAAAEPHGPTLGPGCPRAGAGQREASAAAEPHGLTLGPGRPRAGGDEAPHQPPSSHSTSSVAAVVRRLALPELEGMQIRFDALDERMPVKELRFCFAASRAAANLRNVSLLSDWVYEGMRGELRDWVQENLNAMYHGHEHNRPFAPLMLHCPGSDDARAELLLLEADEVALAVADSDEEGTEEEEEETEEGEMDVVLRLSNFHQVSVSPGHHRREHRAQRARSTPRSTRSFASGALRLPAIGEVAAQLNANAST